MMDRRTFITTTFTVLLPPVIAVAQQAKSLYRVGVLWATIDSNYVEVLTRTLRELGYVEGQNLTIETRSAEGRTERLPELAAELVGRHVDLIIAAGTTATRAAQSATSAIPIVMVSVSDPVKAGFVRSIARPGGNITGNSSDVMAETWHKRLQFLTEVAPSISLIVLLWNRRALSSADYIFEEIGRAASGLKLTVRSREIPSPADLPTTLASMSRERIGGIVFVASADLFRHLDQIAEFAVEQRIPLISNYRDVALAGALMSYGASLPDQFRRAALYADKILKGAKPEDLPVEHPMKLELVINLKTAKALGLTIPPSLLARADQVIE
jgi:putative ABC transport system substrate-binding protein